MAQSVGGECMERVIILTFSNANLAFGTHGRLDGPHTENNTSAAVNAGD